MDPTAIDFHAHEEERVFTTRDLSSIKAAMFLFGLIAGLAIGYWVLPVALSAPRTHAHAGH